MESPNNSGLTALSSGKYITSIHECSIQKFKRCWFHNDLSVLIIHGSVSEFKLMEAFTLIFQQYVEAVSGDSKDAVLLQARKVELYEIRLMQATAIVQYLNVEDDNELYNKLVELGAADKPYPQLLEDQEKWWRVLSGRLKRWKLELDTEQRNMNHSAKQVKQIENNQEEEFQVLLVMLEKHLRYPIDEDKVSVGKLIAMLKDYHQYIKILKQRNKAHV